MKTRLILQRICGILCFLGFCPTAQGVTIQDNQTDEGRDCFKITTSSATYFFDKKGGGFSSILDKDGNDWVGFHVANPCGGSSCYRGLPNMGSVGFHPGYPDVSSGAPTATSTIISQGNDKATIQSVESNGFKVQWDFYELYATMTVLNANAKYWWLYEATPGGADGLTADGFYYKSDGVRHGIFEKFGNGSSIETLPDPEWIFFGGNGLNRVILLIHQNHDNVADCYYPTSTNPSDKPMTVFGFGRTDAGACNVGCNLTLANDVFHVSLVESTDFSTISGFADDIMSGNVGAPTSASANGAAQVRRDITVKRLANGDMSVSFPAQARAVVSVLNAQGKMIMAGETRGAKALLIPRSSLKAGIYLIRAQVTGARTSTRILTIY